MGMPVQLENSRREFMESYHHLGAHSKTLQPTMPARDTWNEQERETYIRCHLPVKESILQEWHELEAGGRLSAGFACDPATFQRAKRKKRPFFGFPLLLLFVLADRAICIGGTAVPTNEIANYDFWYRQND